MKRVQLLVISILILFTALIVMPSLSLADGDYEEGDGWTYQDGVLKITASGGLISYIYHDEELINDSPEQETPFDVDRVVIGKDVTSDIAIEYYIAESILSITTVEEGNPCYVVDNGWIVNTATKTLFGAADVEQKKTLSSIDDLPNYIEHIGMYAFYDYDALEHITIPKNVVSIRESSFFRCSSLKSITLPSKTTLIGVGAFSECTALTHVDFGDQIYYIGPAAFDVCIHLEAPSLYSIKLDTIYGNSFWGCDTFQTVEFPATLRVVKDQAFGHSSLLSTLIFNSDQLVIENGAFDHCLNIKELIFTKGKPTSIGSSLFGETEKTPDGKSFILHYSSGDKIIPYPTLYYTAAYADEWAPNGETEWSGYAIEEISQDELNAILAEARGEPVPTPTAAAEPTALPTVSPEQVTDDSGTPFVVPLLAGLIVLVGAVAVAVGVSRKRKGKKTES